MGEHTWNMLACSIALLTESDLSLPNTTVALAEQLLYLARGEEALSELDQDQEALPAEDSDIPQELWEVLQKIPLSLEYYKLVEKSLRMHPQFWEEVVNVSNDREESAGVRDFSDFPWRANGGSAIGLGLDDYVMLKCLNEASWLVKLSKLMESLLDPISVPLLSDTLLADQTGPILLIYEEACPRSQALMYALEEEITTILKVPTVLFQTNGIHYVTYKFISVNIKARGMI